MQDGWGRVDEPRAPPVHVKEGISVARIPVEGTVESYLVTGLEPLRAACLKPLSLLAPEGYTFQIAAENVAGAAFLSRFKGRLGGWSDWSEACSKQTQPPVPKTLNQPTLRRATHHSAVPWPLLNEKG